MTLVLETFEPPRSCSGGGGHSGVPLRAITHQRVGPNHEFGG